MNRTRKAMLAAVVASSSYFLWLAYADFYSHFQYPSNFHFHLIMSYLLVVSLFTELLALPGLKIIKRLKIYNLTSCLILGAIVGGVGWGFFHNNHFIEYYQGYLGGLLGAIVFWQFNKRKEITI